MFQVKIAVISAAGLGSRLGLNKPKCLVEIGGHRIIDYQLDLLQDFQEVRMVVGYKKDEVIRYVSRIRPDVTFVHNDHYDTTSPLQSFWLGSHDLTEPFLLLDGDVIIEPHSFSSFLKQFTPHETLIGITPSNTEDAVFVRVDEVGASSAKVLGFQRYPKTAFEWTGVALINGGRVLVYENKYVYQCLEDYLPLKAGILNCLEIDTPTDFHNAEEILNRQWREVLPEVEQVAVDLLSPTA